MRRSRSVSPPPSPPWSSPKFERRPISPTIARAGQSHASAGLFVASVPTAILDGQSGNTLDGAEEGGLDPGSHAGADQERRLRSVEVTPSVDLTRLDSPEPGDTVEVAIEGAQRLGPGSEVDRCVQRIPCLQRTDAAPAGGPPRRPPRRPSRKRRAPRARARAWTAETRSSRSTRPCCASTALRIRWLMLTPRCCARLESRSYSVPERRMVVLCVPSIYASIYGGYLSGRAGVNPRYGATKPLSAWSARSKVATEVHPASRARSARR